VNYFHSVRLDQERCKGCTNCIKRCPTEAIRVREGKAVIIEERCIDCGECIRTCPNNAKTAFGDDLTSLNKFDYRIALPAPSLFGQFKPGTTPSQILRALFMAGFDAVYEVALAADYLSCALRHFLGEHPNESWISSSCPAVVRLIQVRFPGLLPQLLPLDSPMELAAQLAKRETTERLPHRGSRTGAFFITPCPAKTTAVYQPEGNSTHIDGTISIAEIYGHLLRLLPSVSGEIVSKASGDGLGWALAGGEAQALGERSQLSVAGIHETCVLLEELEQGRLEGVHYIEAQACPGGCLGGPLNIANNFVAQARLRAAMQEAPTNLVSDCNHIAPLIHLKHTIKPRPILPLSDDVSVAIRRLEQLDQLQSTLPGLDCGACGAPSCRALAEDIVRGLASETDCIIKLRERVKKLAEEMVDLSTKLPPAMGRGGSCHA